MVEGQGHLSLTAVDSGVLVFDAATGAKLTDEPVPVGGLPTDLELLCVQDCQAMPVRAQSWSRLKKAFR